MLCRWLSYVKHIKLSGLVLDIKTWIGNNIRVKLNIYENKGKNTKEKVVV